MTTAKRPTITLELKGAHADRGVSLASFEDFIEYFLGALRAFQREEAGIHPSKGGRPERAAKMATAFRLVRLTPGSAIATLEPEQLDAAADQEEPIFEVEPPQLANLRAMLHRVAHKDPLPATVTDSLSGACRALGSDGSLNVTVPPPGGSKKAARPVLIDAEVVASLPSKEVLLAATHVDSISGFLHQLDLVPDKIGIRAADGVEWTCGYPAGLEPRVLGLIGRVVWATGSGALRGPRRGTMEIESIESIEAGEQSALFSREPIPADELAAEQGVQGPQGLDSLGFAEWTEEDDAYLEALTED